jgi:8-oxo-dGTP diphosphatase
MGTLIPHPHQPDSWIADPHLPRSSDKPGKALEVAVGILLREDQSFLMTTRPPGKVYAGCWEFPGGKVEPGETLLEAMNRELQEELGIDLVDPQIWMTVKVDYPHANVNLLTCKITKWVGELSMREGQTHAWCRWPLGLEPILPGAWPMLHALAKAQGWHAPLQLPQPQSSTSNEMSS